MSGSVHGLVLAAGQGRRFGPGKLLAAYQGRPLVSHVLDLLYLAHSRGLVAGTLAVVGERDEGTLALCRSRGTPVVLNRRPELGLSHSLKLGLSELELLPGRPAGALVLLGDQPLVQFEVVAQVIAEWQKGEAKVVRPRYQKQPQGTGHPVLLDHSVWPLAGELSGDQGLGGLLPSRGIPVLELDVPGDNPDIDTPADLHALERLSS